MPQMMPLNWMPLFLTFIFVLMMINIINYFNFNYLNKDNLNIKKNTIYYIWKW
uniref:ATP synthase complex subunit 8 n=1 Tax=Chrysolina americana TaxID=75506 RepID=A0A1P8NM36_CHRAR|nr:ATP synthase F0 subunit 8 [Chrysolina americana]